MDAGSESIGSKSSSASGNDASLDGESPSPELAESLFETEESGWVKAWMEALPGLMPQPKYCTHHDSHQSAQNDSQFPSF